MVKAPIVATFAVGAPLILPINPLATTAILAGPPLLFPTAAADSSNRRLPAPVEAINAPKIIKRAKIVLETPIVIPKIPSVVI